METTVSRAEGPPGQTAEPETRPTDRSILRLASSLAWPLLIVAAVLLVLHRFVFGGFLTNQNEDVLTLWYPYYCHLGKSLAAGTIPAWNPHVMGGVPFAADPQTGWMYLPAMTLFAALPCDVAMRLYVALLPVLAGLGAYWFLRVEGLGRPASTTAGLALSLVVAQSYIAVSLPFSATFAWTAVLLATLARLLRATAWSGRLLWAAAAAAAWGQLAGAYVSNGLVLGSVTAGLYVVARLASDVLRRERRWKEALLVVGLLALALPAVNLAYFAPRLAYLPRTTLGLGYEELRVRGVELAGGTPMPRPVERINGARPTWPLGLTVAPGSYLGAAGLALALAGWGARRRLYLVLAFAASGTLWYLLSLESVAQWVGARFGPTSLFDFYLHAPLRFRYGLVMVVPFLIGLGVQAWADRERSPWLAAMALPGALVFWLLPSVIDIGDVRSRLFLMGALGATVVLAVSAFRRALVVLVPLLVVGELVAGGLIGQSTLYRRSSFGAFAAPSGAFPALRGPTIDAAAYLRPGPIASALVERGAGRYLTLVPTKVRSGVGYLPSQGPESWGLLANQRAMFFDLEDVQGYNSIQPLRMWEMVRTVGPKSIKYNLLFYRQPPAVLLDLLAVEWLIGAADEPVAVAHSEPVARDGRWELYRLDDMAPRATVVPRWRVVGSADLARRIVARPGFDPSREVILEADPGIAAGGGGVGRADYRRIDEQEMSISVSTPDPALVLVREPYDPNWRATLDGRPAEVLPADFVVMAVAVPPGDHEIRLRYHDPAIGLGLAGTVTALAVLVGGPAAAAAYRRGWLRRRRSHGPGPADRE